MNHSSLQVKSAIISSSSGVDDGLQGSLFLGQCTHNPTNTTSFFPLPCDVLALFPEHIRSSYHSGLCLRSTVGCRLHMEFGPQLVIMWMNPHMMMILVAQPNQATKPDWSLLRPLWSPTITSILSDQQFLTIFLLDASMQASPAWYT